MVPSRPPPRRRSRSTHRAKRTGPTVPTPPSRTKTLRRRPPLHRVTLQRSCGGACWSNPHGLSATSATPGRSPRPMHEGRPMRARRPPTPRRVCRWRSREASWKTCRKVRSSCFFALGALGNPRGVSLPRLPMPGCVGGRRRHGHATTTREACRGRRPSCPIRSDAVKRCAGVVSDRPLGAPARPFAPSRFVSLR